MGYWLLSLQDLHLGIGSAVPHWFHTPQRLWHTDPTSCSEERWLYPGCWTVLLYPVVVQLWVDNRKWTVSRSYQIWIVKHLAMFILYDCVLPHTQDIRPRHCPAALEKTQSENREEFFTIPYHHDVTGSFGSSDVLLDGRSPRICMFLVLQLTQWQ